MSGFVVRSQWNLQSYRLLHTRIQVWPIPSKCKFGRKAKMPRSWPAHGLQFLIGGCTASAFTWWRVSQSWRRVERQFTRDAQLASVPGQFGDNQGSYAYRESCWCDYFPLPVGRSLTADLWCIVKPPSTAQIRKTTAKNDSTTLYMLLKKTPRSIVQLRRLHWRNHQQFHCLRL